MSSPAHLRVRQQVCSDRGKNLQELLLCEVVAECRDVLERVGFEHGLEVQVVCLEIREDVRPEEVDRINQITCLCRPLAIAKERRKLADGE